MGGAEIECRSERAQVMMLAGSLDLHALAVEEETVVRCELSGADAERCFVPVGEPIVLLDKGDDDIALRLFEVPENRFGQRKCGGSGFALAGGESKFGRLGGNEDRTGGATFRVGFVQLESNSNVGGGSGRVGDVGANRNLGGRRRNLWRGDMGAPLGNMYWRSFAEPYVTKDAAARIPAGGLLRVIDADGEGVL